jgi:FkbM family methyltransferase
MREDSIIFDIGMHKGEDTDFYLKKGNRVLSVEANPILCNEAEERFCDEIKKGQLIIINKAIADQNGQIDFYVNKDRSVWGTANRDWMLRNKKLGMDSQIITVESVRMKNLFEEYGMPYYMKVDIEGNDHLCISALSELISCPQYVSIESHESSFDETMAHLSILKSVGYSKFKIVLQNDTHKQICPKPAKEGHYVNYSFPVGSSGLYGEELPGRWISFAEVEREYRKIYRNIKMVGSHTGLFRGVSNRYLKAILVRVFRNGTGWFDTHAKL